MPQLRKLFTTADTAKAMELPRMMNQVPPNVLSSAVLIASPPVSTKLSPHTPGTRLATKKTSAMTRLIASAVSEVAVAACGP